MDVWTDAFPVMAGYAECLYICVVNGGGRGQQCPAVPYANQFTHGKSMHVVL